MDKEPKNQKFKVEDYRDPSRPNLKMMKVGLWLSENRRRMLKVFVLLLISITIGFFVYAAYGYIYYVLVGKDQDKSLTENFSEMGLDLQAIHLMNTTVPLVASAPLSFFHNDKIDLAVFLKNANEKYFASFDYCFVSGGEEFLCGTDFLMPNSEKYLLSLAQENKSGNYQFVIKKTSWSKIDNRKYPDWPAFYNKNVNFVITNKTITSAAGANNLSFTIENKSPYSYWELPLNIILTSGGTPIGVNRFVLTDVKSLEKRPVNISWQNGNLSGAQIIITPDLNILDSSVYRR
jgi:hypothetical protein